MKLGKTVAKMSKLPSISRSPSYQLLKVSGRPLLQGAEAFAHVARLGGAVSLP